jgi:hypothetical protein
LKLRGGEDEAADVHRNADCVRTVQSFGSKRANEKESGEEGRDRGFVQSAVGRTVRRLLDHVPPG